MGDDRSDMPEEFNLYEVQQRVAAVLPQRECLIWRDRRLSYSALAERIRRFASFVHGSGLGVHVARPRLAPHESGQDHLALYLYNGNEYIEAMFGSYGARVAPFNVNYRYVADELRYLLDDSRAKGIVYHAAFAPTLSAVLADLPELRLLVQVSDESGNPLLPGAVDYEEAVCSASPERPPTEPSPDDLYIVYTGGTTGMPKGVLWRQHDIFMAAMGGTELGTWERIRSYDELEERATRSGEVRLALLPPLMHGAAQWACSIMISGGGTLVMPSDTTKLDPKDVWRTVERERVNAVGLVGDAMARPLVDEFERGRYDASSVFAFGSGGAPLSPSVKERIHALFPDAVVSDAAGSSETGAQMTSVSAGGSQSGTFRPGPGAVVVSEDRARVLAPGDTEVGWLAQVGFVPLGYLGDPEKTGKTFPTIQGVRYAVPGDRARLASDGGIELLGRDSVTINSGGEKIFAEEVERALTGHPAVEDVVVAGRPSERWGQEVVALVKLRQGYGPTRQELVDYASSSLAGYKLPKAIRFLPEIVRSPSGKADYRWAREQAAGA